MKDQPGAVNRLIGAVADLGINIVKKESSGINSLNQHYVDMVIDWQTSQYPYTRTLPHIVSLYDRLQYRIPITNHRFVQLYEQIMSRCGDIVHLDDDQGLPLPAISIVPFTGVVPFTRGSYWGQPERVTIESAKSPNLITPNYNVKLNIPSDFLKQICGLTQHATDEPIPYILSSETSSRSLRVFFPRKAIVSRIFHIGFDHEDKPGALSAITKVLWKAQFNILTGLLRKKTRLDSGYEVVVEYVNENEDDQPPQVSSRSQADFQASYDWIKEKIEACDSEDVARLTNYNVAITQPRYPKLPFEIPKLVLGKGLSPLPSKPLERRTLELLHERIAEVTDERRLKLLKDIENRLTKRKPIIFLSYPTVAKEHARLLKKKIEDEFEGRVVLDDYQSADFQVIIQKVIERIKEANYFIGIWHHEHISGSQAVTISPWMPFEYAIALEMGKQPIVVHSDKLPEAIWKRIEPSIAHPGYNDLTFTEVTVPLIINHCAKHWVEPDTSPQD
jgi:predicted amino acid-binding ACT domain protein